MRFFLSFLLAIAMCASISAESGVSFHTGEVTDGYNYILYTPDSVETAKPLIISLHSRSASGKNLQNVDYFGTIDAIESGMKMDAYVVAPQANGPDWDTDRIMKVVGHVADNNNIDQNRIYAIGMSMGGNGVANLVAAHPDKIAAAIILAGSLTKGDASEMSRLPLWIIRGLNDRDEAIRRTDDMVNDISKTGPSRLIYSKVKGLDHRQHERILYMPYFYAWLMSHNLQDENRPVTKSTAITAKMLNNSYKNLKLREGSAAKRKSRGHGPRGPRRW